MILLCKKSLKHSPFDQIIEGKFYQVEVFNSSNVKIKGEEMNAPSWLEIDPHHLRAETYLYNYFFTEQETREIKINNILK